MNAKILNRDFQHPADGWYQIEPKGDHPNRAAGVVQVIDEEAISAIVNRFNTDAQAGSLRHGNELLVDHEHFSDQPDQESRAYGWLQELQNRADGIYGRIRWTATGKAAVDGGDYRFFSTEYDPKDLKVLNSELRSPNSAPKRVRPLRLDGLSLTNMNNNRGQKPITNRDDKNLPDVSASGANQQTNQRTNTMKSIAQKLGLAPEASEDAILGEVTKLQNRLTTLEPLEAENTKLKNRVAEIDGDQCETLLDACGLKKDDARRTRLVPVLKTLKNREERLSYLADFEIKPVEPKPDKPGAGRVLNRADGKGGEKQTAATTGEVTSAQLHVEIRKIMNRDGIKDFNIGYNTLMAERPELFARA